MGVCDESVCHINPHTHTHAMPLGFYDMKGDTHTSTSTNTCAQTHRHKRTHTLLCALHSISTNVMKSVISIVSLSLSLSLSLICTYCIYVLSCPLSLYCSLNDPRHIHPSVIIHFHFHAFFLDPAEFPDVFQSRPGPFFFFPQPHPFVLIHPSKTSLFSSVERQLADPMSRFFYPAIHRKHMPEPDPRISIA